MTSSNEPTTATPEEQLSRARARALDDARAQDVAITDRELVVALVDGRTLSAPLEWFPRLMHASAEERAAWEFQGDGEAIWWEPLDDGVEVAHLLLGWKSGESAPSLQRWLDERRQTHRGQRRTHAWHAVHSSVHHNNLQCNTGNKIEDSNRREGTGGRPLCQECARLARSPGLSNDARKRASA
jgi:hypothetical protein